jgi:hypothetical protein
MTSNDDEFKQQIARAADRICVVLEGEPTSIAFQAVARVFADTLAQVCDLFNLDVDFLLKQAMPPITANAKHLVTLLQAEAEAAEEKSRH